MAASTGTSEPGSASASNGATGSAFAFPVRPIFPANLSAEETRALERELVGLISGAVDTASAGASDGASTDAAGQRAGKWHLTANGKAMERAFKFKTFKTTWDFMNLVAAQCKKARHHPEWSNVYNTTYIRWTTHSSDSLSGADLAMARFCDERAAELGEIEIEIALGLPAAGSASTSTSGSGSTAAGPNAQAQSTEQSLVDTVAAVGAGCCVPGKACASTTTAAGDADGRSGKIEGSS
ncbi:transcriptional coactivator/pterin dehydratase [Xylona heveae TC161]|uniref:4a-hydroxytetrahydrobiopterin dehydratase n=1 Tax=Xylona heveae (strain CBS 132557 / TC161) TaxID=1328760 RepID=A0A165FQE0_XYLHT|nr:transcriptional coactivator/pterin dehydratase [Xylona heveae TC161]KZF21254.1 transcriptional coactivator/pterin dehydratase [Xylona heveae TC161]